MERFLRDNFIAYKIEGDEIFIDVQSLAEWLIEDGADEYDEDFMAIFISHTPNHRFVTLEEINVIAKKLMNTRCPKRLAEIHEEITLDYCCIDWTKIRLTTDETI